MSILLTPLRWMISLVIEDLKEHARERPIKLIIILSLALYMFMTTYEIYDLDTLVDKIYEYIFWLWSEFVRLIGQFIIDLFFAIFEFIGQFVIGIVEGIGDMWKDFKLPKLNIRKLDIKSIN